MFLITSTILQILSLKRQQKLKAIADEQSLIATIETFQQLKKFSFLTHWGHSQESLIQNISTFSVKKHNACIICPFLNVFNLSTHNKIPSLDFQILFGINLSTFLLKFGFTSKSLMQNGLNCC